ncbi:uncharacterized protein IWZ02DRAFT_126184 [Phyllosticta citriasiana]|uniref:uncharacterized protein n=1 Tax=Phyllosticta citriasiana TaxID=595635 RepID=UPI0030FD805B
MQSEPKGLETYQGILYSLMRDLRLLSTYSCILKRSPIIAHFQILGFQLFFKTKSFRKNFLGCLSKLDKRAPWCERLQSSDTQGWADPSSCTTPGQGTLVVPACTVSLDAAGTYSFCSGCTFNPSRWHRHRLLFYNLFPDLASLLFQRRLSTPPALVALLKLWHDPKSTTTYKHWTAGGNSRASRPDTSLVQSQQHRRAA